MNIENPIFYSLSDNFCDRFYDLRFLRVLSVDL